MRKEEIRELVERESQRLLNAIPRAASNMVGLVDNFATEQDIDVKKMGYDATKKVLEAPGLIGSTTPSVQIGKMVVNQQNNQIISPNVLEAIRGAARMQIPHEVKDEKAQSATKAH